MPAKEITFNDVPAILGTIDGRLTRIEGLLQAPADPKPQHQMMTIDELIDYLPKKVKKATIYSWTHNNRIPHTTQGRNLVFYTDKIDAWIAAGRVKTEDEMIADAQRLRG